HSGTIIQISIPHENTSQPTWYAKNRIFNDTNILKFKSALQDIDWNKIILDDQKMNDNYKAFNDTLTNVLNKCIPLRKIKFKSNSKKKWLTNEPKEVATIFNNFFASIGEGSRAQTNNESKSILHKRKTQCSSPQ
ncbi:hypothetical protein SFRURICE_007913, partial [Spodoptera frugiperda]